MSEGTNSASRILDGIRAEQSAIERSQREFMDSVGRPAKPLKAKPLPDLEQREAASFFEGWWHGIAVGSVIGAGLTVVLFTSGVMA